MQVLNRTLLTNNEFSTAFKEEIDKTNLLIAKDAVNNSSRLYTDIPDDLLTKEERLYQPIDKAPPGFFSEVNDEFRDFVKKHEIPQIELSEHVKYPGS